MKSFVSGSTIVAFLFGSAPAFAAEPTLEVSGDDRTLQVEGRDNRIWLTGETTGSPDGDGAMISIRIPPWQAGAVSLPAYDVSTTPLSYRSPAREAARLVALYVETDTPYTVTVDSPEPHRAEIVIEAPINIPAYHPDVTVQGSCSDTNYEFGGFVEMGNTLILRRPLAGWQWVSDGESGGWTEPSGVGAYLPRVIDVSAAVERDNAFGVMVEGPTSQKDAAQKLAQAVNDSPTSGYKAVASQIVTATGAVMGWAVTFEPRPGMLVLRD